MGSISGETIRRAVSGDHGAFNEIYRAYEGGLRAYITSHINDKSQAEDVLQNTFVAVFKNIGQLKNSDGLKTWLYKIAYNECMSLNGVTKRETERYTPLSSFADEDGNEREFEDENIELPEDFATNAELQKLLAKTLNSLPKNQRDCLVLYYYRQKPIAEIAQMLGVSENAVKLRKKSALERLKRKLEKYRKSYNFAFAPMGLLLHKLVGTGKVKSAYTGAAVVRTAGASLAAACAAGVIGVGAIGYFGIKHEKDILPDDTDNSSIEEIVDEPDPSEEGWEDIDIGAKIPEVYQDLYGVEPSTKLVLIPEGTYTVYDGVDAELDTFDDPNFDIPKEFLEKYSLSEEEYRTMYHKEYPIPQLIDEDSTEYRFLSMTKMQFKENTVRFTFEPYLSRIENFTNNDPDFANNKPTMTVNCGLTSEYTINGDMEINGDSVILTFDDVSDPDSFGEMISAADNETIAPKILLSYGDGDYGEELVDSWRYEDQNMVYNGIFDLKLNGYSTAIADNCGLYLRGYRGVESQDNPDLQKPRGISYSYPGKAFRFYIDSDHTSSYILGKDGSITIGSIKPNPGLSFLFEEPYREKIKNINLSDNAVRYGYFIKDDILYFDGGETSILEWFSSDKHFDTVQLPDNMGDFQNDTVMDAFEADRIILGNNNQGFYDKIIALATSSFAGDGEAIDIKAAKKILSHLENYEQYSKTGSIETDIANSKPYYDEEGNCVFYE